MGARATHTPAVRFADEPADFQVTELTDVAPQSGPAEGFGGGGHALYRLRKVSLGTLEAVRLWARAWKLDPRQIAIGGLKDRHAITEQMVTVPSGPRRDWQDELVSVTYLGQVSQPYHASHLRGNRFQVVLRDIDTRERAIVEERLAVVAAEGVANYFDDQRFGSLGESGEFIARPWCLGNWERTIWLAMADDNVHDAPDERTAKRQLRQHWGQWSRLDLRQLPTDTARIVEHLRSRPTDYRGAITRLRHDLRSLYLAAFQSHLFNLMLEEYLREAVPAEELGGLEVGGRRMPTPRGMSPGTRETLGGVTLPLPSARLHLEAGPLADLIARVLAREGLELRQIRVKYPRDTFFSKGERAVVTRPAEFAWEWQADERYAGRVRVTLRFELPRGCYATLLVKSLAADDDGDTGRDTATE